ncbi:phospholipid scramblase 1-like isoform X1 [Babylonia areolata]|uniref:phospholipid scramblase 1-like isoform X1 n=1 Tax=Babylonia areolata TaxID=304850 RepID=UPI003FD026E1
MSAGYPAMALDEKMGVMPAQPMPTGAPGQPIAMQPTPGGGAPPPAGWTPGAPPGAAPGPVPMAGPANCPPGLEYLASVDQLLVKQKMEALEAFTGFETNNKYEVLNTMGQRVFMAVEDTCCCTRCCCGSARPFDIKVMDNHKKEVMHLERPLRCECCLCFCCLQKMEVQAPKGHIIGYVRQAWNCCCIPKYKIQNADDETVLRMRGPCFRCNICGDIEFEVTSPDESTHVGQVSKQWSGLAKEVFTDADNFGVTFPLDMDVKTKATILGAVFLIDFMYFEEDKKDVKKEIKRLD